MIGTTYVWDHMSQEERDYFHANAASDRTDFVQSMIAKYDSMEDPGPYTIKDREYAVKEFLSRDPEETAKYKSMADTFILSKGPDS